ncbi:NAD(P)H-dependent oxidoreductase [Tenacibaculum mesophilum]|uniref:Flavodoxin family protein n=1 Tax=Tenacibaculum mesophilum TaxID=104268 RepID=A0ABN5T2L3_9FLAO|nr:NAD(P)H-dependent oxidoreductase [Tenacibaculum mesophilum]AZJ31169.1 flavodoxin family protein [Tenacibaculum mesophilum]QFS29216.1 flavodoxin family protein [Tenacibaculum mesophilum]
MKTLMILAHPNLKDSVANKHISTEIAAQFNHFEISDIFNQYPDFKIDVEAEQAKLLAADTIIFQFPFFWYNMPAILKQWFDEVFSFNFAYGSKGDKLRGKNFLLSITVGGPEEAYTPIGYNHFAIEELIRPLQQTAYLSQMNYLKPVYTHGLTYVPGVYNTKEVVLQRADNHIKKLAAVLEGITNTSAEVRIERFVKDWFAKFDVLADASSFTPYINNDTKFQFVEGEFTGIKGFETWYTNIKNILKPNNEHRIESIIIQEENNAFDVYLTIKLKAEKVSSELLQLNVKEHWKLVLTTNGQIQIKEYIVNEL